MEVVIRMTYEKWGFAIQENEIGTYHRLNGGALIVEFLKRGPNSTFQKILTANWQKGTVYILGQ